MNAHQIVDSMLDDKPIYHAPEDEDEEVKAAARQPFTAHELAVRRGKHHPALWAKVKGSPFEGQYRRQFNPTD